MEQDAGQHIGIYSEVYIVLQNIDSDQNYINEGIVQLSQVLFLSKKLAAVLNRKYTYAHSAVHFYFSVFWNISTEPMDILNTNEPNLLNCPLERKDNFMALPSEISIYLEPLII